MFDFVTPVAFFMMIVWIIKIISDNKIRRKAIESGNTKESLKYLWEKSYANKPLQNIKWAIIFGGIGITILVGNLLLLSEEVLLGISMIVVGIALVVYYKLENK